MMNNYNLNKIIISGNWWFHQFLLLYLLSFFFGLSKSIFPAFFTGLLSGVYISCLISIVQYTTWYCFPLLNYITDTYCANFGFQPSEYELVSKTVPRVSGFFFNPNVYAYALAMALMGALTFLFMKKPIRQKILVSLIFLPGVFVLAITYSRGGWIAFICGVFGFLWFSKKRLLPFAFSIILIGSILFYSNPGFRSKIVSIFDIAYISNIQRIELLADAWGRFLGSPMWGVGLYRDDYVIFYRDYQLGYRKELTHSHNMYLEFLSGVGVFGFLSLMAFFMSLLKIILKSSHRNQDNPVLWSGLFAVIIIFLVGGLFDAVFKLLEVRSILFACLSILFFMEKKERNFY